MTEENTHDRLLRVEITFAQFQADMERRLEEHQKTQARRIAEVQRILFWMLGITGSVLATIVTALLLKGVT